MGDYRFYFLDSTGRIVAQEDRTLVGDADAEAHAGLHIAAPHYFAVEVWRGGKLIARQSKPAPNA